MFTKVLVANRGEIACRIIRTLDQMGIASVAVYSEADRWAPHVGLASEAVYLGAAPAIESYLCTDKILQAAQATGAQAVHPGYGFLSENADFAEACSALGIAFIGPTPQQLRDFGLKHRARELAQQNGVPLLPGTGILIDSQAARVAAQAIGYPVMIKSSAGGGGIGLRLCSSDETLVESFAAVERLSRNNFGASAVFLEKYVEQARHIEVQIFGDGHGRVLALGERDCSLQRRNQKVIEETPAPDLDPQIRAQLWAHAERLGAAVQYQSAGTVEFILDQATGAVYFLEMNTRLQVEHGITELVTGIDLVAWMIRQAAGERAFLTDAQPNPQGWALEVRLYAENPAQNFQPSTGVLTEANFPQVRCDTWVARGTEITPYYDPLLAKIMVHGATRAEAIHALQAALSATKLAGIETNLDYVQQVLGDLRFQQGAIHTRFLTDFAYTPATIDVLEAGTQTTVQDHPGRTGYWAIGVPPSGPMDPLAFRLANRIVGNPASAAGLECTVLGPTLRFNTATVIVLSGAVMAADLDGKAVPFWTAVAVPAGGILRLGSIAGAGYRTYLAVQGGLEVPDYLGSKATFTLGQFGGHCGRTLRIGDVLKLGATADLDLTQTLDPALIPTYSPSWEIGVLYGPHGAPDFFTDHDIQTFFSTAWEVHYNSARTGVRLIGPKPQWARQDGGEAGLHPSNIHDNAYALGTIDFTGDMPVILGPDGPSLGGFVCPATIIQAELWKIGQLKPGDTVRFYRLNVAQAHQREQIQEGLIAHLRLDPYPLSAEHSTTDAAILHQIAASEDQVAVVYRQAGDKNLLIEYGPLVLDLNLRFRVHALMTWLEAHPIEGVLELTPGIRSLQVHYDSQIITQGQLLEQLIRAEAQLPPIEALEVPTRIIYLPLAWEDEATLLAIRKYMQSVRDDAPWCPSNIEFIRRVNGLETVDQVREIVFGARYLVLGLGDVYLGAPVAVPLDPRHRLITTKYNPARTWTPENAVGIGGAYLCVYGMEGPGGYQFVGRTIQMWNRYRQTQDFQAGKPWLLRFFDQICFYPVSGSELLQLREAFIQGHAVLEVREEMFSLRKYNQFLTEIAPEAKLFKIKQQTAFQQERERWAARGEFDRQETSSANISSVILEPELPEGSMSINTHISANVWQVSVATGDSVNVGDTLVILESMKMEVSITSPVSGLVVALYCEPGKLVATGQMLCAIQPQET